jgi:hypothetical protein
VKKLYQTAKWKAYSRRRARRELQRRQQHKLYRRKRRRKALGVRRSAAGRRRPLVIRAPEAFSLIHNATETITFFAQLGEGFRRRNDVFVDLSRVDKLTSDAILILVSKLSDPEFVNGMNFSGNEPEAVGPKELLRQSGFFQFVRSARLNEPPAHGRIRRKSSYLVEPDVADDLVRFATEQLFGQPQDRRPIYLALIECMANTHEHAGGKTVASESWWTSVYCPPDKNRAFFTIADNGIGIFKSITVRQAQRKVREVFGGSGNPELLRDWLEGRIEMPSRTRQHNRGKGLRAIYNRFKLGGMSNLILIANDVYANLAEDRYERLPVSFRGTFFYWELHR